MLTVLTWLATTRIGRMAVAAGALALGALALIGKGRRDAELAEERRKLKDYQETRKRADDALRRAEADTRAPTNGSKNTGICAPEASEATPYQERRGNPPEASEATPYQERRGNPPQASAAPPCPKGDKVAVEARTAKGRQRRTPD